MPRKTKAQIFQTIPYEVNIGQADNDAYIVNVGCKRFIFTNPEELLEALSQYLINPSGAIKAYQQAHQERLTSIKDLQALSYPQPVCGETSYAQQDRAYTVNQVARDPR